MKQAPFRVRYGGALDSDLASYARDVHLILCAHGEATLNDLEVGFEKLERLGVHIGIIALQYRSRFYAGLVQQLVDERPAFVDFLLDVFALADVVNLWAE